MSAVLDEAALEHMGYLETEITSYIDDLAAITIELTKVVNERDALRVELIRIKSTGECI